jgi:hypothetical protein
MNDLQIIVPIQQDISRKGRAPDDVEVVHLTDYGHDLGDPLFATRGYDLRHGQRIVEVGIEPGAQQPEIEFLAGMEWWSEVEAQVLALRVNVIHQNPHDTFFFVFEIGANQSSELRHTQRLRGAVCIEDFALNAILALKVVHRTGKLKG